MEDALKQKKEATPGFRAAFSESITRGLASIRRFFSGLFAAHWAEVTCAALLLLVAANLCGSISRKSITIDEVILIPAAYYNLVTNDFQLVREHPPLCKLLAGVPLLFIQPDELAPNQMEPSLTIARRFWQDNRARFEAISFWSRVPMIALTIGLGLLTFIFARDMFGPRAALFAVALFAFEPTLLAHGRVVQTDLAAAFSFLLTVLALQRYWRAPNWKLAAGVGAAAGLAMLTKFSMVMLGPALLVVFLALLWRAAGQRSAIAWHGAVATVTLVFVINAGYFFRHQPLTNVDAQWIAKSFPVSNATVLASVRVLRFIMPTDFLMGIYWQVDHSSEGHPAGLLGMQSQRGWWYYFPVAFALKTTIPFLLVSLSSLIWATYRVVYKRQTQLLFLLIPFAFYTVFVMMSPIDIGIRYYLPAICFLTILGGVLFDSLVHTRKRRAHLALTSLVFVTLSWMCWEAVRAYPNYMTHMNQLASARPHWWYLSDSNVEWGDEVKELAKYLRDRGETRARAQLLAGDATLDLYGVEYVDALAPTQPSPPRYLALGASFLNGSTVPRYDIDGKQVSEVQRVNTFDEFRHRAPEAVIGNSIYVYRIHE